MKVFRAVLAFAVLAGLASLAYDRQRDPPAGGAMTLAAADFLGMLTPDQQVKVVFPFDDKERLAWAFVPLQDKDRKPTRKGLALEQMNEKQREAARRLVQAGTSESGYRDATTIMSLESILRDT